jgi:hypothetical protein
MVAGHGENFHQNSEKFIQNQVFDLTSQSLRFEFLRGK